MVKKKPRRRTDLFRVLHRTGVEFLAEAPIYPISDGFDLGQYIESKRGIIELELEGDEEPPRSRFDLQLVKHPGFCLQLRGNNCPNG
jgi:hypothetical protein